MPLTTLTTLHDLRICLVLNSPSPHQVDLLNAIAEIPDVSAQVAYAFPNNPKRTWGAPKPNLPWTMLPADWKGILSGELRKWVQGQSVDVWVLSSIYTAPRTQYLARLLSRYNASWAYLGEAPRPASGIKRLARDALVRSVLKRSTGFIGTGQAAEERYRGYTTKSQPSTSVPYYIDVNPFLELPLPICPQPGEPVRFVTSAQLIYRKGIDVLLDACATLPDSGWQLEIYGSGPLEKDLRNHAERLNKPVRFMGTVPYHERQNIFQEKHCFIFSTRWDGWGMVLPEALGAGLPVISTNMATSAHDFLKNGVNGFIGPSDDSEFLNQSMRHLIENPETIPGLSQAARQSVTQYQPEIGARRIVEFLNTLDRRNPERLSLEY